METIIVTLSTATILFSGCPDGCPALIGNDTPTGKFRAVAMEYRAFGFKAEGNEVFAVHPAWTDDRAMRLESRDRRPVTAGCVNVSEETFAKLPRRGFFLEIRK